MRFLPSLAAAALGLCTAPVSAQLVISEVAFDSTDSWIELYNRGTIDLDLTGQSIYHATKTPHRTGNYWWPVPTGTMVKKGEFLVIHWGQAVPTNPPAGHLYTGTNNVNFLFGHGYETLNAEQGALAICLTQDNRRVNEAGIFSDWVQWGANGFPRDSIAFSSTLWTANTTAVAPRSGASLMLFYPADATPTPANAFDEDFSPTPGKHNLGDAGATSATFAGCTWGPLYTKAIELTADDLPFHGNRNFSISIGNTLGPARLEVAILFWQYAPATVKKYSEDCFVLDGVGVFPPVLILPTAFQKTTIPLPLDSPVLKGFYVALQAVTFVPTGDFSVGTPLNVRIGKD